MSMTAMEGVTVYAETLMNEFLSMDRGPKLVFSLFLGYPLAFLYRFLFIGRSPFLHHIYFAICGLGLCYFNFGWDVIYSFGNIMLIYLLIRIAGGTKESVILGFIINTTYLMVGYYYTMKETYTIDWTTPHCVLCLRLIGLMMDIYDGSKSEEHLSSEQKETALKAKPSLLEVLGHSYFFGGFLVGPQFSMRRYLNFVNGKFLPEGKNVPDSIGAGFYKLFNGVFCIVLYHVLDQFFPDKTYLSPEFLQSSFFNIFFFVTVWSKVTLYKYVGCWLITEGVCTLCGLTCSGKDENGVTKWDGCANIHFLKFEKASTFQELVNSFNVNTNKWMSKYIFKRLKFLGNKDLSQICTLLFLALWHGLYSGYFANFILEFFIINFEKEASSLPITKRIVKVMMTIPGGWLLLWIVKKIHVQFVLGYALIAFCLFTYPRYVPVYHSLYYCAHIFYMVVWRLFMFFRAPRKMVSEASSRDVTSRDDDLKQE